MNLAANFHVELNNFIGWLTDTEKTLNNLQPVSRLIDRVTRQIEDHRVRTSYTTYKKNSLLEGTSETFLFCSLNSPVF